MEGSVRKRGKKWYYRFSIAPKDGKYRQIERYGGETRKEALNALRTALNLYHNTGTIPNEGKLSANDFFEYWYKNYVLQQLAKNTQINYRNILDKYVLLLCRTSSIMSVSLPTTSQTTPNSRSTLLKSF